MAEIRHNRDHPMFQESCLTLSIVDEIVLEHGTIPVIRGTKMNLAEKLQVQERVRLWKLWDIDLFWSIR